MPDAWRPVRRALVVASAVWITACEQADQPPPPPDTTVAPTASTVEPSLPPVTPPVWDAGAGAVLLVRDDSLTRAIYPSVTVLDSTAVLEEALVREFSADAFHLGGAAGSLRVRGFAAAEEECALWPAVQLANDLEREWTVALARGVADPVVLRPIESLAQADSARLAAQLTRLAARLPNDTARAFQGLPFTVRAAYVFDPAPGVRTAVADILRRVNVEANPREEALLLVAERDTTAAAEWQVAYAERSSGSETAVVRSVPLGAVRLRATNAPALIVERGGPDWIVYALVQRGADGVWRERWRSAQSGC